MLGQRAAQWLVEGLGLWGEGLDWLREDWGLEEVGSRSGTLEGGLLG